MTYKIFYTRRFVFPDGSIKEGKSMDEISTDANIIMLLEEINENPFALQYDGSDILTTDELFDFTSSELIINKILEDNYMGEIKEYSEDQINSIN